MPHLDPNLVQWLNAAADIMAIPGCLAAIAHLVYAWRRDRKAARQRPVAGDDRTAP
jgi:hypothetical protein